MNIAMRLTFDALIRALRVDAQRLANDAEQLSANVGQGEAPVSRQRLRGRETKREALDDRGRD